MQLVLMGPDRIMGYRWRWPKTADCSCWVTFRCAGLSRILYPFAVLKRDDFNKNRLTTVW